MNLLTLRRLLAALAVLTVLGCSGLSNLVVANKTDGKISVKVSGAGELVPKGGTTVEVGADANRDSVGWFGEPPSKLDVEAKLADGTILHTAFTTKLYPAGMRKASAPGAAFYLDVTKEKMSLREASAWENFRRNPQMTIFPALILLCPAGVIGLIVFLMIRGRRTPPPDNSVKLTS